MHYSSFHSIIPFHAFILQFHPTEACIRIRLIPWFHSLVPFHSFHIFTPLHACIHESDSTVSLTCSIVFILHYTDSTVPLNRFIPFIPISLNSSITLIPMLYSTVPSFHSTVPLLSFRFKILGDEFESMT